MAGDRAAIWQRDRGFEGAWRHDDQSDFLSLGLHGILDLRLRGSDAANSAMCFAAWNASIDGNHWTRGGLALKGYTPSSCGTSWFIKKDFPVRYGPMMEATACKVRAESLRSCFPLKYRNIWGGGTTNTIGVDISEKLLKGLRYR